MADAVNPAGHHNREMFFALVGQHRQARRLQPGGVGGPGHQLVGFPGHGRDHHGDLVAALDLPLHQAGDMADALNVGHGGAAEFHRNQRHAKTF